MNVLYYNSICAKSRFIRILMSEFGIETGIKIEEYWKLRENFLKMNPSGELPILLVKDSLENKTHIISGVYAITEYLFAKYRSNFLLHDDEYKMAEIRKYIDWCANKMNIEVTSNIINEKIICFYRNGGYPNSQVIRSAKNNLDYHLEYLSFLLSNNDWVVGNRITVVDLFFAAHISILDYLGEIAWSNYQSIKSWYMLVKSRPSFKSILNEKITGFAPSHEYELLDF